MILYTYYGTFRGLSFGRWSAISCREESLDLGQSSKGTSSTCSSTAWPWSSSLLRDPGRWGSSSDSPYRIRLYFKHSKLHWICWGLYRLGCWWPIPSTKTICNCQSHNLRTEGAAPKSSLSRLASPIRLCSSGRNLPLRQTTLEQVLFLIFITAQTLNSICLKQHPME